jgi:hypothetical protein
VTEECVLDVAGRAIAVTSPGKVFFSERGETNLDLQSGRLGREARVLHVSVVGVSPEVDE